MVMSSRFPRPGAVLLIVAALGASACQGPQEPPSPYAPHATVKDIMEAMIDPSADVLWNSVATVVSAAGTEIRVPHTDEDWAAVRQAMIRVVEATNLLVMPGRHVALPHEKSKVPGIELEPEEMEVLIKKDPAAWIARATKLREVGLEALKAIDARNAAPLDDIGERLDIACENCHVQYWYPNQVLPPGYEETAPGRRTEAAGKP